MLLNLPLQAKLAMAPSWFRTVFAAVCSFGVYFSMYAFRKPFTAAGFEGLYVLHADYKVWLVTAQVLGYMASKFYGIRFISALQPGNRALTILKLVFVSWGALLLFALVPAPFNIPFLFVNGFPLGMIWGLVFSYLEGRRSTELMGAVLCTSFIFSSGVVKSIGKFLILDKQVPENWMPFVAGALFILPIMLFTWLLDHMPSPSAEDIRLRRTRDPMSARERKEFIRFFLPGIILIVTTYTLLTVLRDFRDNFANELWAELGYANNAAIFTRTEIPVSLIVLCSMSLLILVRNNFRAFMINHYLIVAGYVTAFISTLLFMHHLTGPVSWMICVGTGLYMSYVPFNALYFERMIASYRIAGNVGFIMYVADSFGYLGSVAVLFVKQFMGISVSWTVFFTNAVLIISFIGIAGTVLASLYFKRKWITLLSPPESVYVA